MKQWEELKKESEIFETASKENGGFNDDGEILYHKTLCKKYASGRIMSQMCVGCPIATYTGKDCCQGTPWGKYGFHTSSETAKVMADWLKDVSHKLFRLDR